MKKKKLKFLGFSIMELIVSFMVVAVIAGASTLILFKKSSKMKLKSLNSITTSCSGSGCYSNCALYKKSNVNNTVVYTCIACKLDAVANCKANGGNYYFDNTTCTCGKCESKFSFNSANDSCIRCNLKYCTGCKAGYELQINSLTKKQDSGCKICQKGTYSDNKNNLGATDVAEACKTCPIGYYCPNLGMSGSPGKDKGPIPCPIGYYCDVAGMSGLPGEEKGPKPCPPGYYCPDEGMTDGKKYKCPAGCACPSTMGKLSENFSLTEVGRTLKCPMKVDDGNKPYPCAKNYYCPEGTATQKPCRDNSVTEFKGTPDESYCKCNKGYFLLGNICTRCADGTVKVVIGNDPAECKECSPGYYCPEAASNPIPCPENTYKSTLGGSIKDECTPCDTEIVGSKSLQASTSKTDCKCAGDTYKVKSSTESIACGKCSNGTLKRLVAGTMDVYECTKCPSGHYCSEGASNPTLCPKGTYQPDEGQSTCSKCDAGTYQPNEGQKTCLECKCGTYQPNKGQKECLDIPSGKFANKLKGATAYGDADTNIYVHNGSCYRHANNQEDCKDMKVSSVFTKGKGSSYGRCVNKVNRGSGGDGNVKSLASLTKGDDSGLYCWDNGTNEAVDANKTAGGCESHTGYPACHRVVCNKVSASHLCNDWHSRVMSTDDFPQNESGFITLRFCDMKLNAKGIDYCANRSGTYCGKGCRPALLHMLEGTYKLDGHEFKKGSTDYAGSVRCTRVWFPY